jgi:hypothetical protein
LGGRWEAELAAGEVETEDFPGKGALPDTEWLTTALAGAGLQKSTQCE